MSMKKKITISIIIALICFILILFSHKIGIGIADSAANNVIDTEEYWFIANNIAQSIKIVAGIIASFALYLAARSITKSK